MAQLQGISQQLLQSLTPSALGGFQQGQADQQAIEQGEQQAQLGQQKLDANSMKLAQGELTNKGQEANSLLTFDNPESLRANLIRRAQEVSANPVPGLEAEDFIDMANRLGEPNGFMTIQNELKSDIARIADISGKIAAKTNEIQSSQFIPGVGFATITRGGKANVIPVEGSGETVQEKAARQQIEKVEGAQSLSDIAIQETEKKESVKQRVSRVAELKKEFGDRRRNSARSNRTISEALTLVSQADQGLTGTAKLKLSKLLPGIDASDEAALDSVMKQLALEQLQNFKGPTTDFEFGVTESIVGGVGNSKESNQARLNSLKRASWFNNRESQQFDKHIKSGGDPEAFSFNFGEPVNTKKGVFTLQDIQDTAVQKNLSIEETIKRLNR